MNNENLEVLEMEKDPSLVFNSNSISGDEMADDFFDDDLVNLDFNGLDSNFDNLETIKNVDDGETTKDLATEAKELVQNPAFFDSFKEPLVEEKTDNENLENKPVEVNKTIEEPLLVEDKKPVKKENMDNSYNLSNFDVLFDSLYNDVAGANDLITNLIEKKSSLSKNEKLLEDFKEKFEKEKEDFRHFVEVQKKAIESEKEQAASFIESKRARLHSEEAKFNEDSEAKKVEISLLEQALKLEREKFETEKANFEEKNKLELEKIRVEREKLQRDIDQFTIDKKLSDDLIKNGKKDLHMQQEQFARYRELEQKKLDLEEKNLSQSCARFKELVSQFNSGFEQLPNDNNK